LSEGADMTDTRHQAALAAEKEYYAGLVAIEDQRLYGHVLRHIDIRVSKSQSVLTHTSIMIAVLGAIIAFTDRDVTPGWITVALLLELLGYIGLTAYLVLTMAMSSPAVMRGGAFSDRFIMLARKRRRIHNFVVKAVAPLTLILALTLIAEFLFFVLNG
jgi:hypothetical protein